MNDIEWKDGAVCYADVRQWTFDADLLTDCRGNLMSLSSPLELKDFQLNEPRQGDYIPKSELDTEQKYNDAVGELGLFGFVFCGSSISEYSKLNKHDFITCCDDGLWQTSSDRWNKRPLTYNQLMAIGKLKRLTNERDRVNTSEKPNSCDKLKLATQYLNECIKVQKQRGEKYDSTGTGERSFAAAASAFNALTGKNLKGSDVCLLLTCVKAVRQYSNPNRLHEDSLLDGVSYLSLWAEELNKELK